MIYDIESLMTDRFYKIIDSGDLKLLFDDGIVSDDAMAKWHEIVDKFNDITDNQQHKNYLIDRLELLKLTARYDVLTNCIKALTIVYDKELIAILHELGYKFDENKVEEGFENLHNQSRALFKKIERKKSDFVKKYGTDEYEKEKFSVYIYVKEIAKKLKIQVDIKTTPLILFAYYIKDLKTWQTAE